MGWSEPITRKIVLFGLRSPLVVDYEETCRRAAIEIVAAVSVNGAPRVASDLRIVDLADFNGAMANAPVIACAFTPARREALTLLAGERGMAIADALCDPTAIIASTARIGPGSYVNAAAVIAGMTFLGDGVVVNRSASIGHHTMLADYVSIGPGVTLAGSIRVGARAVIGAGAVVQPGVRIGAGALVAAGSVVRRNVPDRATVAGNPAVLRRYDARRGLLHMGEEE